MKRCVNGINLLENYSQNCVSGCWQYIHLSQMLTYQVLFLTG